MRGYWQLADMSLCIARVPMMLKVYLLAIPGCSAVSSMMLRRIDVLELWVLFIAHSSRRLPSDSWCRPWGAQFQLKPSSGQFGQAFCLLASWGKQTRLPCVLYRRAAPPWPTQPCKG